MATRATYEAMLERYLCWERKLKTGFEAYGKRN